MKGYPIAYAEVDGIPVCIVDGAWCEREAGHAGPHAFAPYAPFEALTPDHEPQALGPL